MLPDYSFLIIIKFFYHVEKILSRIYFTNKTLYFYGLLLAQSGCHTDLDVYVARLFVLNNHKILLPCRKNSKQNFFKIKKNSFFLWGTCVFTVKKVNQSRYRPGVTHRVPGS